MKGTGGGLMGIPDKTRTVRVPKAPHWVHMGSALEIFTALTSSEPYPRDASIAARRLLTTPKMCGVYLSRLATKYPKLVRQYRGHGGINKYQIYFNKTHYLEGSHDDFATGETGLEEVSIKEAEVTTQEKAA